MDDQNQHTSTTVNSVIDGSGGQSLPNISVSNELLDPGTESLSLDPSALGKPPPDSYAAEGLKSRNPFAKLFKRADVLLVLLVVGTMAALLINGQLHKNNRGAVANVASQYGTQNIPLNGF
ncbi:MAG: hypothetical protein ABWY71_00930, partial [Candidatus Saccharimonadales bacterium]